MVTVGYGDVKAFSTDEKIVAIISMTILCGSFAYFLGNMSNQILVSFKVFNE